MLGLTPSFDARAWISSRSLGHYPSSTVDLPEPFDPLAYFYAYVCRRSPLVLTLDNRSGRAGKPRLPEGWRETVRAVTAAMSGELNLPQVGA